MKTRLIRDHSRRSHSSIPAIERLESRQLLSASVDNSLVVFSNAKATGNPPSAPRFVTLTNTGSSSINYSSATITVDTTDFLISSQPAANAPIAPGGSIMVGVTFTAPSGTSTVTLHTATLTIKTTDTTNPSLAVNLRALALTGYQGGPEPSLFQIADTLYQVPINFGFTSLTEPYTLNGAQTVPYGDEAVTQTFVKHDSTQPVTVQALATFGPAANPVGGTDYTWGYYTPGNASSLVPVYSATTPMGSPSGGDGQTVNPTLHPDSPATLSNGNIVSFNPGTGAFGVYGFFPVVSPNVTAYSQDALNAGAPIGTGKERRMRFWPMKDAAGDIIPHAYLAGIEEATNNDLQDVVYVITNVDVVVPAVTAVSPPNGPAGGGTSVTLTGTGFTSVNAVNFGSTPASSFTYNSDTSITAVAPAGSGTVDITVVGTGGTSAISNADHFTYGTAPAPDIVGSPVINGDNPNGLNPVGGATPNQRSMVEDVVYTFDSAVTIPNANTAFTVVGAGMSPGTAPTTLSAAAVPGTGGTQWAITLTGQAAGTLASIANGEYSITVNAAGICSAANGTTTLAGGAGEVDRFYRLFGDVVNGDRTVNAADNLKFKAAINGAYNPIFDFNGDGTVNASDNLQFKNDLSIGFSNDTSFILTI